MFRKLILASAVSLAMFPGTSWSLGLGGIRTQSALNEPFAGEIDLYDVRPDELDTVKVVVASPAEFAKTGASRPHFLTGLRFTPQVSPSGSTVVRVGSREPIREPYMDFLVEVTWPKGRMVKGYTVLLDPPVTLNRTAPRVERPRTTRRAPPSAPVVAPPPVMPAVPRDATGYPLRFGPVPAGTGLWRVARSMAPPGVTVGQTAMALYRNNQHAFIRGDINKLKLGAQLEIPTPDELFALDRRTAEREFQTAMRGGKVTSTPLTDVTRVTQPVDRLEIAAAPVPVSQPAVQEEPEPPLEGGDAAKPELGAIQQELLLVQEAGESTRQETDELRARIRELEVQLADIRTLLELRNEQLAQIQVEVDPETGLSAEALDSPPLEETTRESSDAAPNMDESLAVDADLEKTPQVADPSVEAPSEQEVAAAVATGAVGGSADSEVAPADFAAEPLPGQKPFWETIPSSTLGLVIGVPLILLGLGLLLMRRRSRMEDALQAGALAEHERPLRDELQTRPPSVESVPGRAGSEGTLVSSNLPALSSGFDHMEDETDEADIIAEADVYIAYGRYREAETLLGEAIDSAPERLDLKLKLAEAHFGSRNRAALQDLVTEMRGAGVEQLHPDQWQRCLLMVQELEGPSIESSEVDVSPPATFATPRPVAADRAEIPQRDALSGDVSGYGRSGILDQEPDSRVPSEPVPIRLPESVSRRRAEVSASEKPGDANRDTELNVETVGTMGSDLLSDVEGGPTGVTTGLELKLEDLESLEDFDLTGFGEEDTEVKATSAQAVEPPSSVSVRTEGSVSGAPLSSLDITQVGKDSVPGDVLSSQWQMDSGLWDEVATKIDLARAYMEMEDPEAARVILEEVAAEGNDEQQVEATEMLSRLD